MSRIIEEGSRLGNWDQQKALLYHSHHSLHNEDVAFWLALAAQEGSPILELACGTGRVLIPLIEAGFDVTGLDHDPDMLAFLSGRIPKESLEKTTLVQADLADFRIERNFALIFIACNTFSTLSAPDRNRVLSQVTDHLQPGGLFAASIPNPTLLAESPEYGEPEVEEIFTHPISGIPIQVSSEFTKGGGWFSLRWHYDLLHPEGLVERHTIETQHGLVDAGTYIQEMADAGLVLSGRYGDFNWSDYRADAPHLILVARKKKLSSGLPF
jgi:SAM-dependent methyltransferase